MNLLNRESLHTSVSDPVLETIGFLNEVMGRYPDAISFAPGAPHPGFLADLDPAECTERFLDHLVRTRSGNRDVARRLLFEYGPSAGIINDLVADALRGDGIDVPAAAIVMTVGAQEALLLVLRALFGGPGDVLAVTNPCFVGIIGAARLLDVPVTGIGETEHGIALDELASACHATRARGGRIPARYVPADFADPGGGRMSLECRRDLLDLAEREDFLVIEDNAYGFIAAAD